MTEGLTQIVNIGPLTLRWPDPIEPPDPTDCISPEDYRYWDKGIHRYFSPRGIHATYLAIELAVAEAFQRRGRCDLDDINDFHGACQEITSVEIYELEKKTDHDVQAVVEGILSRVGDHLKPIVHAGGTSYDVLCSANAISMRDCTLMVIIPELRKLLKQMTKLALATAELPQTGRSHLQHGSPITFGFWAAEYVSRLSDSILALLPLARNLKGKYRGAMGNALALSFLVDDPLVFEHEVLAEFQLEPAPYSSQVVPHDDTIRLLQELTLLSVILSNIGEDIRLMAMTEVGELVSELTDGATGSTAMPQKVNPWRAESACSAARVLIGRIITALLNGETDFQRDLRDSLGSRTYGGTFNLVHYATKKIGQQLDRMTPDPVALDRNLRLTNGANLAEAWNAALRAQGCPNAHELMKELAKETRKTGESLPEAALKLPSLAPYISKMTPDNIKRLTDPVMCTGLSAEIACLVVESAIKQHGLNLN